MHGSTWNWWLFEAQGAQKAQWPIWESIGLITLGPGLNSHQSFGQWLKFLTNLTNLTNLLSRNLGKTQMAEISKLCTHNFNNFNTVKYVSKNIMEELSK